MKSFNWVGRTQEDVIPHMSYTEYKEEMARREQNLGTAVIGLIIISVLMFAIIYGVAKLGEMGLIHP